MNFLGHLIDVQATIFEIKASQEQVVQILYPNFDESFSLLTGTWNVADKCLRCQANRTGQTFLGISGLQDAVLSIEFSLKKIFR